MKPVSKINADSLGEIEMPKDAMWGASTQRAINNFKISDRHFPDVFIQKLCMVKACAAEANSEFGLLDSKLATAISDAALQIYDGKNLDQFPIDIFQTGSGTSTNMNANEVIARIANLKMGNDEKTWNPIHPNDHVNMGQSSNDVMPSALYITAASEIRLKLIPALQILQSSLSEKSKKFSDSIKVGRTHLMDALPITLGQEFGGWSSGIERCISNLSDSLKYLEELPLGATAVGNGFGTHPKFADAVCSRLSDHLNINFYPARDGFDALSSRSSVLIISGAIKATAIEITRIAENIRLLASGPRFGICEITLPAIQLGSSIMPGKINPVIPEAVIQAASQISACEHAISIGASSGHLELNTHLPLIAINLLDSIALLTTSSEHFSSKCIDGIRANKTPRQPSTDMNPALATALAGKIGYDAAAKIAKTAVTEGISVREAAEKTELSSNIDLDKLLDQRSIASRKKS